MMAWWLWNKSAYNNYELLYVHNLLVENCYIVVGEHLKKKLNLNFIFIESMRVQMSTTWEKKILWGIT